MYNSCYLYCYLNRLYYNWKLLGSPPLFLVISLMSHIHLLFHLHPTELLCFAVNWNWRTVLSEGLLIVDSSWHFALVLNHTILGLLPPKVWLLCHLNIIVSDFSFEIQVLLFSGVDSLHTVLSSLLTSILVSDLVRTTEYGH